MRNVGIYLFNNVELLDFAGPYEVFSTAAELNDRKQFRVFTISEDGGAIKPSTDSSSSPITVSATILR